MSHIAVEGGSTPGPIRQHTSPPPHRFSDPNVQAEIERLERTIESLLQTVQRGHEERHQLLRSLTLYTTAPMQTGGTTHSDTPLNVTTTSAALTNSATAVGQPMLGSRVPSPFSAVPSQRKTSESPQQRRAPPSRSTHNVSPSRARNHTPMAFNRSDSTSKTMETWHHSYHGSRQDPQQLTYNHLLADNRAMYLSVDALQKELRCAKSEHEQRVRLMQRKLTEATQNAQQYRDRCTSLENEVAALQRAHGPTSYFSSSGPSFYDPTKLLLGSRKFSRSLTSMKTFERTRSQK